MFAVLFEVHPHAHAFESYLDIAKMLRPELERIDGFIDNVRYRSLTRDGALLSLSSWRDEKALVRWRTQSRHNGAQKQGRQSVFSGYHLRVGQFTADTRLPSGQALPEQRLDETVTGDAAAAVLRDARRPAEWVTAQPPETIARWLGLDPGAAGLVAWDVFDAILSPGDVLLLTSWRDRAAAQAAHEAAADDAGVRERHVRIIRDYGMFDRREAPQFYPDAPGAPTIHA